MPSETNTNSNTVPSSDFTLDQFKKASSAYSEGAFEFYQGYTNAFNAAIQAGVDSLQGVRLNKRH
jgi:hypothetical protein